MQIRFFQTSRRRRFHLSGSCVSAKELRCGTFADAPLRRLRCQNPRNDRLRPRSLLRQRQALGRRRQDHLSVEGRIPVVKLGRVDVTIANLASTLGRAEHIQFSDPYYLAEEMLAVMATDPGTTKADFTGKRLASTKDSTSPLAIKLNNSAPLTFQDTGSA